MLSFYQESREWNQREGAYVGGKENVSDNDKTTPADKAINITLGADKKIRHDTRLKMITKSFESLSLLNTLPACRFRLASALVRLGFLFGASLVEKTYNLFQNEFRGRN